MTQIGFTIGAAAPYGDYVYSADIWRDSLAGIGRWEILMDPLANYWPQDPSLAPDTEVHITIDGSTMMRGYIDDVEPELEGLETDFWRLSGRDFGLDLSELFYDAARGEFVLLNADNIVNTVLTGTGSEITPPVAPWTDPIISYKWGRGTYLGDGIRDICQDIGYDFYVQDDVARTLHFFAQNGAPEHTGVDLTLVPNALDNNILLFKMGERLGSRIKNYVHISGGDVRDHWTDLNSADYTPRAGCVASDETVVFTEGNTSIEVLNQVNLNVTGATLDFTGGRYGHTTIDMRSPGMGTYSFLVHYPNRYPAGGIMRVHLYLVDNVGTTISYYRNMGLMQYNAAATYITRHDRWRIVDKIPFGDQSVEEINFAALGVGGFTASDVGYWFYVTADPGLGGATFDWSNVEQIQFTSIAPLMANDYFLVDDLRIPGVEARGIAEDAGVGSSQAAYGIRQLYRYRSDIKQQVALDEVAAQDLAGHKDPLETLEITAIGQVASDYAGQTLDVRADSFGLGALTRYRITGLHHMVRRSSAESSVPGWTFLTEYSLVRSNLYGGGVQNVDYERLLYVINAQRAYFRQVARDTQILGIGAGVR